METDHPTLSDAELDALRTLWDLGPQPAGRILEVLNGRGRGWAYTTAKTILSRLEGKGYVVRDTTSIPHVYLPVRSAEAVACERVARIRRDLFGGAGLPLVRALVDGAGLSRAEIAELRSSLNALERGEAGTG